MSEIIDAEPLDNTDNNLPINKISVTRGCVKFLATNAVRFVVSSAITTLVPVDSRKDKRKVWIASMVISGVINEQVKPYVDNEINEALEFCREVVKYTKKLQDETSKSDIPNP